MKLDRTTIRNRRKALGLHLWQLGRYCDPPISAAALSRIENGISGLSPGMALRLRDAFAAAEAAGTAGGTASKDPTLNTAA